MLVCYLSMALKDCEMEKIVMETTGLDYYDYFFVVKKVLKYFWFILSKWHKKSTHADIEFVIKLGIIVIMPNNTID